MAVERILTGKPADILGFGVRRILPQAARRMVGPFVFFDHMGPADFAPGSGMDVPPHPHIGLATLTYLFEGEVVHRDSLGVEQLIRPGDVNWMVAGGGVVHSERSSPEWRRKGGRIDGLQCWVALPVGVEEGPASFAHHGAGDLPQFEYGSAALTLVAGRAYDEVSPVSTASPLFYVHAAFAGAGCLPLPDEHAERAVYVIKGDIRLGGEAIEPGQLAIAAPGPLALRAASCARIVMLGGAPLPEPRHINWNFVASSHALIDAARRRWRRQEFPPVPGETEFVPLPE